ncbi:MAG: ABC transporter permease [Nocardioides sp.]|nr:ABC transporter permease [Nocardioides sp.]
MAGRRSLAPSSQVSFPRARTSLARTSLARTVLPPLAALLVLLIGWQLYVMLSAVEPRILPSPLRVVEQGWRQREIIADHALATLTVTLIGFGISLVVAWVLAIWIDFVPGLRTAVLPLLVASQTLPIIAIAPLMILWFGFGLLPKVLVIVLVTFFPIALGLIEGFSAAGPRAGALLRAMGASRWQQFRYVRLPAALPRFFTALRIGITYAVVGAIFAEYVGAVEGLGIYMSLQKNSFRTDLVLAAVAVTAALSVSLFLVTYLVERLVVPWNRAGAGRG